MVHCELAEFYVKTIPFLSQLTAILTAPRSVLLGRLIMHRPTALTEMLSRALKGNDARKCRPSAPDPAAQARELYDLRVVDEQVRARALVLDMVRKHVWVRSLEPTTAQTIVSPAIFRMRGFERSRKGKRGEEGGRGDVHDLLRRQGRGDGRDDVRPPVLHVLGDALALDHDHLCARR